MSLNVWTTVQGTEELRTETRNLRTPRKHYPVQHWSERTARVAGRRRSDYSTPDANDAFSSTP